MTNNFLGNEFTIRQDVNNYITVVKYQINLFGLGGPMKLRTILMNNFDYECYNIPPYYNLGKYFYL